MKNLFKLFVEKKVFHCIFLCSVMGMTLVDTTGMSAQDMAIASVEPSIVATASPTVETTSVPTQITTPKPTKEPIKKTKKPTKKPKNTQKPKTVQQPKQEVTNHGKGKYSGIKVSSSDRKLLAQLVKREAGGESFKGQKAVVEVVLNRVLDSRFPNTIRGVVFQKGQFSTASKLSKTTPTQTNYDAVDYVLEHGATVLHGNYVYFSAGKCHGSGRIKIGNQWFGKGK
jgi:spore germination cell wall hydrolase CwlJ-like protein